MRFKDFIIEEIEANEIKSPAKTAREFDQEPYVSSAIKWLKKKFPDNGFTFKHTPKLRNPTKTYQASIDGKDFDIEGRLMDTNSDGSKDTVLFKISSVETADEKEAAAF